MPTDSVEAAQTWRALNSKEGLGHKGAAPSLAVAAASAAALHATVSTAAAPADAHGILSRMREIELEQYAIIKAAIKKATETQEPEDYAVLSGLYRSYNVAGANALAAAKDWERHCRASGQVAPIEHLVNVLMTRLDPLAAQLRNFAALVAAKANPAAPAVAESAIAAELDALLRQIGAARDGAVPPAPAP
jgi:hypothetical protein